MKTPLSVVCAMLAAVNLMPGLAADSAAAANLVVNGSFEASAFSGIYILVPSGSTAVPGWEIVGINPDDNVAVHKVPDLAQSANNSTFADAQDGVYYLDLSGSRLAPHPAIQQSVPTTPGATYTLSFYIGASNVSPVAPTIRLQVGDDASPAVATTLTPLPPAGGKIQWQRQTFTFRATASSTRVRFMDVAATNDDASYVDNVSMMAIAAAPPVITSAVQALGAPGTAFLYQTTATEVPTVFAASNLPAGLSIDAATGLIAGKPAAAGVYPILLGASNALGTGTAMLTLTVAGTAPATPLLTSPAAAAGIAGGTGNTPFSYQITATNSPVSFAASPLPPGLSFDPATGVISGNATVPGRYLLTISASNAAGTSTATLTLLFTAGANLPVVTSPAVVGYSQSGQSLSFQITAANNPSFFGIGNGSLPAGLSLNSDTGQISGTPTVTGVFQLTLNVGNSFGVISSPQALAIGGGLGAIIEALKPKILSSLAAGGQVGTPFIYLVTADKGANAFDATPLPAGLSVDRPTGVVSGTPTTAGSFPVTLRASNAALIDNAAQTLTGEATLMLTIAAPPIVVPVLTSNPTASGQVGAAFSYQITASNTPTSFGASGLPGGLMLNTTTGLISGMPTAAGSFSVTLSAANAAGSGQSVLTLTVSHPSFFTGEVPLTNGVFFLQFPSGNPFGYYSYLSDQNYIFHQDLGFEYVFDANDGKSGVYFFDFKSGGFFYTSPSFPFPYLYDFTLNTVLYYFPDPNNPGRYNTNGTRFFYRFDTGQIFSK